MNGLTYEKLQSLSKGISLYLRKCLIEFSQKGNKTDGRILKYLFDTGYLELKDKQYQLTLLGKLTISSGLKTKNAKNSTKS